MARRRLRRREPASPRRRHVWLPAALASYRKAYSTGTAMACETHMHSKCIWRQYCCTIHPMSRHSGRRRRGRAARVPSVGVAPTAVGTPESSLSPALRMADKVEVLVYSRRQAAAALGVSLTTLDRRIVPVIETVKMPWGTRLI